MGRTKRRLINVKFVRQKTRDRIYFRDFKRLVSIHFWQYRGKGTRKHCLSCSRRALQKNIVKTRSCNLKSSFCLLLSSHLGKVEIIIILAYHLLPFYFCLDRYWFLLIKM